VCIIYASNAKITAALRVDGTGLEKGLAGLGPVTSLGSAFGGRSGSENDECHNTDDGRFKKLHDYVCKDERVRSMWRICRK
jgi:hypothetical protein